MRRLLLLLIVVLLGGCRQSFQEHGQPLNADGQTPTATNYQRFVFPAKSTAFPEGSVALDTATGQLCKTYAWPDSPNAASGLPLCSSSTSASTDQRTFTLSYSELARTKLFRGVTEEGRITLLRQTDAFFSAVDNSAQHIIVNRLVDETKTAPEFDLPDNALCAFDEALWRSLGGVSVSPCNYTVEVASCATPAVAAPPTGYILDQDMKPCFTVRPHNVAEKH